MEIISKELRKTRPGFGEILLRIDRQTLAKRRWRGVAEDGREFGFDLQEPLADGAAFFESEEHRYCLAQNPEPVLEVKLPASPKAAQLGWMIGNLHFPLEVSGEVIRAADDPALRQLFAREHIAFTENTAVFHPLKSAHAHAH